MNMQIVLSRPQIIIVRSRLSLSGKFRFRAVARWPIIKVRSLNQFRKYWPSYLKWGSSLLIKEFWSIRVNLSLLSVWIFFIVNRKIKNSKRGERNPQLLVKLHSEVTILNILRCMCAKARWQWNIFMLSVIKFRFYLPTRCSHNTGKLVLSKLSVLESFLKRCCGFFDRIHRIRVD